MGVFDYGVFYNPYILQKLGDTVAQTRMLLAIQFVCPQNFFLDGAWSEFPDAMRWERCALGMLLGAAMLLMIQR